MILWANDHESLIVQRHGVVIGQAKVLATSAEWGRLPTFTQQEYLARAALRRGALLADPGDPEPTPEAPRVQLGAVPPTPPTPLDPTPAPSPEQLAELRDVFKAAIDGLNKKPKRRKRP